MVMSPVRKRSRKNIVTPEKGESALQPSPPIKHAALSIVECEYDKEFNPVEVFEYDVSCEDVNPEGPVLTRPTSPFNYDSPSETESDISAGFGGWLTNERTKSISSINIPDNNKENVPPSDGLSSPLIPFLQKRSSSTEATIPRFPLLPRNDYGGIRDCLPPEQLARWVSGTASANTAIMEAAADPEPQSIAPTSVLCTQPQHKTFTAEQLLRMEHNRLKALEKLRAKGGE